MKKYWILIVILPLFGFTQSGQFDSLMRTLEGYDNLDRITALLNMSKQQSKTNLLLSIELAKQALNMR